ncbi:unnamed protein product, partial [marine sediment metagenome]
LSTLKQKISLVDKNGGIIPNSLNKVLFSLIALLKSNIRYLPGGRMNYSVIVFPNKVI